MRFRASLTTGLTALRKHAQSLLTLFWPIAYFAKPSVDRAFRRIGDKANTRFGMPWTSPYPASSPSGIRQVILSRLSAHAAPFSGRVLVMLDVIRALNRLLVMGFVRIDCTLRPFDRHIKDSSHQARRMLRTLSQRITGF